MKHDPLIGNAMAVRIKARQEPPVFIDAWRLEVMERDRAIKCDAIDRKTDHIKHDMERLVTYIRSLFMEVEPLDETSLKRIEDAKLALGEAVSALLAIRLAENEYRNRVTEGHRK